MSEQPRRAGGTPEDAAQTGNTSGADAGTTPTQGDGTVAREAQPPADAEPGTERVAPDDDVIDEESDLTTDREAAAADSAGTAAYDPASGSDADSAATTDHVRRKRRHKLGPMPKIAGHDVLGLLGRGAMGVVYKARQHGLNRTVALKMIRSGEHATSDDLERFCVEAEAVARLQHPNIVQIYQIGSQEGRPYFSLEYVDGKSLAVKIAGNPLPPREAAALVEVLARAMQYAHERGVIHRDLKPGNVLLTADGQPKLSDFGVAKRLGDESGRTHAGSVLGTPSYMSPEQAQGRTAEVGPLADVYALGAILYEMLTGRAPFRAATVLETLDLVRSQEPVAPTELQPGTPHDLETICLKCLQKYPRKRYASAAELADDLHRFGAGEPIRARPVPAWERAWRWCRRNRTVATLSTAVAVLVLAALGGSIAFSAVIYQEKKATEAALERADRNFLDAEKNRAEAVKNAQEAEIHRAQAVKNHEDAERNLQVAKKNALAALQRQQTAVNHLIGLSERVHHNLQRKMANPALEPELKPMRDELVQAMKGHMLAIAKEFDGSGITSFATAYAHQRLGDQFRNLGLASEAMQQYVLAMELAKKVAEDDPKEDRGRGNWAFMLAKLGDMEIELRGDVPKAQGLYQKALELQEDLEAKPSNRFYSNIDHARLKANYHFKLGTADLLAGQPTAARKHLEEAVALRRQWVKHDPKTLPPTGYLAEATLWLADASWRTGDVKEMRRNFDVGIGLVDQILVRNPHHDFKADRAEALLMFGDACSRLGNQAEARKQYEQCPALLAVAVSKEPENLRYLGLLARLHYGLGLVLEKAKDPSTPQHFADALKWQEKLLAIDTESLPQQVIHASCLARAGKHVAALGKADKLRPTVAKDPDLLIRLAGVYAVCGSAATDDGTRRQAVETAVAIVRGIVQAGYQDAVNLRTYPDLAGLPQEALFDIES